MFWPLFVAPFVGSFLGVLVRRLPQGRPVVVARSACETCGSSLGAVDLIPLLSFVALRGRCRHCGVAIGTFHLSMELAALAVAGVAVLAGLVIGSGTSAVWANCVLGWTLLGLAWIDVECGRLPDVLTLPLLLAGLAATWWLEPWHLVDHAAGAVAGYAMLRLTDAAYVALRGRHGLGQGDAKLFAAIGAWVGWDGLVGVLLLAALSGLGYATWRSVRQHRWLAAATSIPFGPFLAAAAFVARLMYE